MNDLIYPTWIVLVLCLLLLLVSLVAIWCWFRLDKVVAERDSMVALVRMASVALRTTAQYVRGDISVEELNTRLEDQMSKMEGHL